MLRTNDSLSNILLVASDTAYVENRLSIARPGVALGMYDDTPVYEIVPNFAIPSRFKPAGYGH